MNNPTISGRFQKLTINLKEGTTPPAYGSTGASGFDLRANNEDDITIPAGGTALVPTGLHMAIPAGFEMQVRSRSGLAAKNNVFVLNTPGTVDSDYRGEVKVILHNAGSEPFTVQAGDRIAQGVICPVVHAVWNVVESLESSERGEGGFGSTGVK
jgi:dUTP pyrophosphatase